MGECDDLMKFRRSLRGPYLATINAVVRQLAEMRKDMNHIDEMKDLVAWLSEYVTEVGALLAEIDVMTAEQVERILERVGVMELWVQDRMDELEEEHDVAGFNPDEPTEEVSSDVGDNPIDFEND